VIGVPMPNPRDSITANLNQQLNQFFGAGRAAQQIAAGVSGEKEGPISSTRSSKLREARDKEAPKLRALADTGKTVIEAANELGMNAKRARLIARENSINFPGPP